MFFSKMFRPGGVIDSPPEIRLRRVFIPPPTPNIRSSLRMVEEIGKAAERAARCLDETQLHDALRSVRYFLDEAEKRVGEEQPAEHGPDTSAKNYFHAKADEMDAEGMLPIPGKVPSPAPWPAPPEATLSGVVHAITCHDCRYYTTGSKSLHCLMAPDNPGAECEKLRNGLIGICADLVPND